MKAVIMAGGEGTRLRPLTCTRPKPMIPIANKPILEHVVDLLKKHGLTDYVITVQYLKDKVIEHFGDGSDFGVKISYSVEERPLGTAGGVKAAEDLLDDTFLVMSGDIITDFNLQELIKFHKSTDALVTIAMARVENPLEFGVIVTDENGRVIRFLEKPGWSEVFSDTINAGIYVVEPKVLKYIEPGREYDFSKDLFPLLLKKGEPIYGYLCKGYWCDVGTLQVYMQAQRDILDGKVQVEIPGRMIKPGVWVGKDTFLESDVSVKGPAILGNEVRIRSGAKVLEYTVIGDAVTIDEKASLKYSTIMNNAFIGYNTELRGCIIGERVSVHAHARVFENAVIGDETYIGTGVTVKPGVKIWPAKVVEPGAIVHANVIWGTRWARRLFGPEGVVGVVNVEITPEFASRLGASIGSCLRKGASVVASRDTFRASRMVKRSLLSGVLSSGVYVHNLRVMPTPVLRFNVRTSSVEGGIAVTTLTAEPSSVAIRVFDSEGLDIGRNFQQKIERIFFREEFRRVYSDEVGSLVYPARAIEYYRDAFLRHVDIDAIQSSKPLIVADLSRGAASVVSPHILGRIGCDVVTVNAGSDEEPSTAFMGSLSRALTNLSNMVRALDADLGVLFSNDAEKIYIVDDRGNQLFGDQALALCSQIALEVNSRGKIVVPISASHIIEAIVEENGGEVVRVKMDPRDLVKGVIAEKAVFGGTEAGGFIFPSFHPFPDGIFAVAKLAEYVASTGHRLSDLASKLPKFYSVKGSVSCPWELRGKVFRSLIEEVRELKVTLLDGIKIYQDKGWVLILPSPIEPVFNVYAESQEEGYADKLLKEWVSKLRNIVRGAE